MQSEPSDSRGSPSPRALQKEAWVQILPVPLGHLSELFSSQLRSPHQ